MEKETTTKMRWTTNSGAVRRAHCVVVLVVTLVAVLAALAPTAASASEQVVNFFGGTKGTEGGEFTSAGGIAVNNSGAGGVPAGTIYVTDGGSFDSPAARGNRVERFELDDHGTPADPSDDTYRFVSAWGAGVEKGGTNYEVCTVAADCRAATGTGGNGTLAGDGSLNKPSGIAVDQDTGDVYVLDASSRRSSDDNLRINIYSATGVFLRSFGWGVVESGPDDNGTDYDVCVAGVDVCKAGLPGSGVGQIVPLSANGERVAEAIAVSPPDGNPATGTVFVADVGNHRVNTYDLDGTGPSFFGSSTFSSEGFPFPESVAVDSRGIVYANNASGVSGEQEVERYDSQNADGGGVGFLAPLVSPPLPASPFLIGTLAVDPVHGPVTDVLYVAGATGVGSSIQQFGPLHPPGLTTPPSAVDDTDGTSPRVESPRDVAIDQATGQIFVTGEVPPSAFGEGEGVYVLDSVSNSTPPTGTLDSLGVSVHSITVHGSVDPNGFPPSSYRVEYSTDGANWKSTSPVVVGSQSSSQTIEAVIEPPLGLLPNTLYHVRLVIQRRFAAPVLATPSELTATTLPEKPSVETVGSPIRTATTVRLDSRVDPDGSLTEYHFEYGMAGPCDANPCQSTAVRPAGSGQLTELVSQELSELQPNTTYHYRIVADNGNPDGPVYGEDMTVTTRASDAPLSHDHFPGPPGSDRAWEQVNVPDTSGNPVTLGWAFSNDGDRAVYTVAGGLTQGTTGNLLTPFFAERTTQGWQTKNIYPGRDEIFGQGWTQVAGTEDLSDLTDMNTDGFFSAVGPHALFRIGAAVTPVLLRKEGGFAIVSNDGTRVVTRLSGALDPAYPTATEKNYYDISSGSPHLLGLLPGNTVPACGATGTEPNELFEPSTGGLTGAYFPLRAYRWLSPDGSLFIFPSKGNDCSGSSQLYMREIEAEETVRITPEVISGPECSAALVKSTPEAVFFWTQSRLVSEDTAISGACLNDASEPESARGGDIYRYNLASHAVTCVTCVVPGLDADVQAASRGALSAMAVAADGSRVYFTSPHRLLPGAPEQAVYRVDVASGELAYVAPGSPGMIGEGQGIGPGTITAGAVTSDGSFMVFESNDPALDSLTGSDNGHTSQFYIYDDEDRSLICASCPQDGSAPVAAVPAGFSFVAPASQAPNITPLADNGDFAFVTPTPLISADQNTAAPDQSPEVGDDVYEWRDGRLLLVTDGLTSWVQRPEVQGMTPSGSNLFFTATAQYTPDALDAIERLYDARIGGGIEFPVAPKPCPLEVCQGTPKGAPEEAEPGSAFFAGPGNLVSPLPGLVAPKEKTASRAVMLAKALRACRKANAHNRVKRRRCEAAARKRYGTRSRGKKAGVRAAANHNRRAHR